MRQDAGAAEFASEELKGDRSFMLEAVKLDYWALSFTLIRTGQCPTEQ